MTMTDPQSAEQRRTELIAELQGRSMYEVLGAEAGVRRMVDAFYDALDADERFAPIRRMHAADLSPMRELLYEYLSGWFGGPALYVQRRGSVCMTGPHAPYAIGRAEADLWVQCMDQALVDAGLDLKYREALMPAFERMAHMIQNRD